MNDPHVEKLHYKIRLAEFVDYANAKPIVDETPDFKMSMIGDMIEIQMKKHFSTEEEARICADEYIERWEIYIGIVFQPNELSFNFLHSEIFDRSPPKTKPGEVIGYMKGDIGQLRGSIIGHARISRDYYPCLPKNFSASNYLVLMYDRYCRYLKGKEPLLDMANFCLTVMENNKKNEDNKKNCREIAADKYLIQKDVLDNLGRICAIRGDGNEARKAPKDGVFEALRTDEKKWVIEVIKSFILRFGEWECGSTNLNMLTMDDFPDLKNDCK